MRTVPWWGLASSAAAPVLLIGGWTIAAGRQPDFDPVVETISALAGLGATDRWIMTTAFIGTGLCHLVTALALRPAAPAGRVLVATGGVGTLLVAATPLPVEGGSAAHTVAASLAFVALAAWPALGWRRDTDTPWALRPVVAGVAAAVLLGLVAWFAVELGAASGRVGLAERVAAGAQSVWPFVVALSARRR